MPKKAPSIKNRIWERDRRNRFNASFDELASLLPEHNSKNTLSKVLVVQKATELIRQLQKNEEVLQEHKDLVSQLRLEISGLKKECIFLKNTCEQSGLVIPHLDLENPIEKQSKENSISYEVPNENDVNDENKIRNANSAKKSIPSDQRSNSTEYITKEKCLEKKIVQKSYTSQNELNITRNKTAIDKIKKKLAVEHNGNLTKQIASTGNSCPVFIIMNDTPIVSQPLFNTVQTSTGLTIIKSPIVSGIKIIESASTKANKIETITKKCIPKSKRLPKPVRKIASKGFKLDLNKTIILNKVPIPALKKRIDSASKSETKIKTNSLKRVTYRVLRQSKILKKRVLCKKNIENSSNTKSIQKNVLVETLTKENMPEIINPDNINETNCELMQIKADTKTDLINKTAATTIVTYSIDSLCNANFKTNMIPEDPKLQNKTQAITEKEQISEMKKDLCIDNNSKCDPLSDLSNDIFASLQVQNHQNGCTSPTAAFLHAFPLVSSQNGGKMNQVIIDENTQETNSTLIQNQKNDQQSNLLNLDQFSTLFSSKDMFSNIHDAKNSQKNQCDEKCAATNIKQNTKPETLSIENKILSISSDNYGKSECLYTYTDITNGPNIQNNLYNFDTSKDEKNKFSHTNIISDTLSSSCLNENYNIFNSQKPTKYCTDINNTMSKSLTSTIATSSLNEIPLMTPYAIKSSTEDVFNSYTPFYSSTNKDKPKFSTITPSLCKHTSFSTNSTQDYNNIFNNKINTNNPDCDIEKQKIENNYIGQELKYTKNMRYKPYMFNTPSNNKIKKIETRDNVNEQTVKLPVNWMTSPDIRSNQKFNMNQNYNYSNLDCNTITHDVTNKKDPFFIVPPNNNMIDESLNTWSNSMKIQDQSQLNLPVTLPTLVGDLALGTSTIHGHDNKQYPSCYTDKKDSMSQIQKTNTGKICTKIDENHHWSGNFSVSQLVDQFKSDKDIPLTDRHDHLNSKIDKNPPVYENKRNIKTTDICNLMDPVDMYKHNQIQHQKGHKKYSAEALISDDVKQDINKFRQQQFYPYVDFMTDIKTNKQYTKTSNTIASSTYSYNNHMPNNFFNKTNNSIDPGNKLLQAPNDIQTQPGIQQTNMYKPLMQDNQIKTNINTTAQYAKKSLKRNRSQENSLLDLNYMPVSTGNHSPIQFNEDPFYNYPLGFTTNTPSQSYQNQNILYSSNVRCHLNQHQTLPTFSSQIPKNLNGAHIPIPSPNITNNSSSLTNFNLSTIFPEINDKIRTNW